MGTIISDLFKALPGDIVVLPSCADEIDQLIGKSGIEFDFADNFDTRVRLLERYKKDCIRLQTKKFEKISGQKNLYAIRFKLTINLRILFSFENGNIVLLLCAFAENRGESDYQNPIKTALARQKTYREENL